jgi:hypothetical protein
VTPAPAPAASRSPDEFSKLEAHCLRLLLHQPESLYQLDRDLHGFGLEKLLGEDFADTELEEIFRMLVSALEQVEVEPLDFLRQHLEPALQLRLEVLLHAEERDVKDHKSKDELLNAVLRLRKHMLNQQLNQLRFLADDAREQGDVLAEVYQPEITRLAAARANVDRALSPSARRNRGINSPSAR